MRPEKQIIVTIAVMSLTMLLAPAARADWDPGDGHKMHYPQLPDPNGWDVNISIDNMFDDWQCSETGPVDDIHFWASWRNDVGQADPLQFNWIRAQIYADMPAPDLSNPNDPNPLPYSHPTGEPLWEQYFSNTEISTAVLGPLPDFTMIQAGVGAQGWLDPQPDDDPTIIRDDHDIYYQINFDDIPNPFLQEEGTIYWLALHASVINYETQELGWKTSADHWNDDAVFYYASDRNPHGWWELIDPNDGVTSLDFAFVITPEPVTLIVLALGLVPMLLVTRRRRIA